MVASAEGAKGGCREQNGEIRDFMKRFFSVEISVLEPKFAAVGTANPRKRREFFTIGTHEAGADGPAAEGFSGGAACSLPNALKNWGGFARHLISDRENLAELSQRGRSTCDRLVRDGWWQSTTRSAQGGFWESGRAIGGFVGYRCNHPVSLATSPDVAADGDYSRTFLEERRCDDTHHSNRLLRLERWALVAGCHGISPANEVRFVCDRTKPSK
jgi:hypothetical protein